MDPKSGIPKNVVKLERIQRRVTKYILSRLSSLDFLPLMYEFEFCDILFCFVVHCLIIIDSMRTLSLITELR